MAGRLFSLSIASLVFMLVMGCGGEKGEGRLPRPAANAAAPTAEYVGSEACASCHEDIYQSYRRTGMGRSLYPFDPATAPEQFGAAARVYDAKLDLYYEPFVRGDTLFQREFRLDESGAVVYEQTHPVRWVVGSGNATRSYLMEVNGIVTEMPLTWYVEREKWDLSPSYEQTNQRFSRPIAEECMTCHNGLPEHTPFTRAHYTEVPEGITCERCHGPGSDHVEARLSGMEPGEGTADATIVNPAHLSRDLQLSVCQQCHLTGITVFASGEDATTYRPGEPLAAHRTVFAIEEERDDPDLFGIASHAERLALSACYQQSEMTCTTCHDPHQPVAELGVEHFNTTCQSCHTPSDGEAVCSRPGVHAPAEAMTGDCVGCHLQKSGTSDIPHVTFTDHWIRRTLPPGRRPSQIDRDRVRTEPFRLVRMTDTTGTPFGKAVLEEAIAYYTFYETRHRLPAYLPQITARVRQGVAAGADHPDARLSYGKALAAMDSMGAAATVFAEAIAVYPVDPRLHLGLGTALLEDGRPQQALAPLQQALTLQPRLLEARLKLAETYEALGQMADAETAYRELLNQDPVHHPGAWNNLGLLYFQQQRVDEAEPVFERAISLDPNLTIAIVNLGSVRLIQQDMEAAKALFERALKQEPDNVSALGNLGLIQAQQGNFAEARDLMRRVLAITPNDQRARAILAQIEAQLQ